MPIIRRTRPCITAYGVVRCVCSWVVSCVHCAKVTVQTVQSNSSLHTVHTAYDPAAHNHNQYNQCRTSYAVIHSLVLLMMGIMMPETC